jgi:DNA-binding SARP family transcriptional activator
MRTHAATTSVELLGSFRLSCRRREAFVPMQSQRLLAYLAIHERPVSRSPLATTLWPLTREPRAQANLRTALWRIRQQAPEAVIASHDALELGPEVEVDYRLLFDPQRWDRSMDEEDVSSLVARLRSDLLPGWDDEWLLIERERGRQIRMRRLETLSGHCLSIGDTTAAIDAAYASIEIEPLRETAHIALIEAHIRDGNLAEAAHQARRLTELVHGELGIDPSPNFSRRLVDLGLG